LRTESDTSPFCVVDCVADVVQVRVRVNDTARLICNIVVAGDVAWYFYEHMGPIARKKTIYLTGIIYDDYKDRFAASQMSKMTYILTINSAKISDNGYYECNEYNGQGVIHHFFQLISEGNSHD